jgi:hypothetical protein
LPPFARRKARAQARNLENLDIERWNPESAASSLTQINEDAVAFVATALLIRGARGHKVRTAIVMKER